jgi:hypothetical protein
VGQKRTGHESGDVFLPPGKATRVVRSLLVVAGVRQWDKNTGLSAKLFRTRRALSIAVSNSRHEPVSGQACNALDPH